jgi:methionyl-tRNA formyltransferase
MKFETIFLGNEAPYLETLYKLSELSMVVCEPLRGPSAKIFGSAYQFAKKRKIEIISPSAFIKNPGQTDLIVVSGFSRLIPRKVIESARVATVNIHQSLLPAYRGRHPLNWAIINGETYTGVTIHHVSEGFDEGNVILQKRVKITDNDTVMDIYWKTVEKSCEMLHSFFRRTKQGDLTGFRQDPRLASYFPPRTPKDGKIDWTESAEKIFNLVRALTYPYPGAYFYFGRKKIVIENAQVVRKGPPGAKVGIPVFYKCACLVKTGSAFLKIMQLRNRDLSEIKNNFKLSYI